MDFCEFEASLGLQSEFQDSQDYTEKPCLEKPIKKKKKLEGMNNHYFSNRFNTPFSLTDKPTVRGPVWIKMWLPLPNSLIDPTSLEKLHT